MSTDSRIPLALKSHRQFPRATCAVSAFESVAKLHGLIETDSFPLQSNPQNENKGFGDRDFLESLGLSLLDDTYYTKDAVALIEKETNEGRFPLVSLLVFGADGKPVGYHIYLCALHNAKLLLIDPAGPRVVTDGKVDLEKELEYNRLNNPERNKLHILTYYISEKKKTA